MEDLPFELINLSKALGNDTYRRILLYLAKENEEVPLSELEAKLKFAGSKNIKHNLSELAQRGLVKQYVRTGQERPYSAFTIDPVASRVIKQMLVALYKSY